MGPGARSDFRNTAGVQGTKAKKGLGAILELAGGRSAEGEIGVRAWSVERILPLPPRNGEHNP